MHQAPRFHAYFSCHEGRNVLKMSRRVWDELNRAIQPGELVGIDLEFTPIAAVMRDSRVEAVVAERLSASEVVIDVYRRDPKDMPTPINRDRYRVWESLPAHVDYSTMVNAASTEDNPNMRGFLDDHVFLVKDEIGEGHWLRELPERVRKIDPSGPVDGEERMPNVKTCLKCGKKVGPVCSKCGRCTNCCLGHGGEK